MKEHIQAQIAASARKQLTTERTALTITAIAFAEQQKRL